MRFVDKKQKLDYLIEIIRTEKTGKAEQLAERIYVSKRTLERYLSDLREIGYKISFCSSRKTYFIIEEL